MSIPRAVCVFFLTITVAPLVLSVLKWIAILLGIVDGSLHEAAAYIFIGGLITAGMGGVYKILTLFIFSIPFERNGIPK